MRFGPIGSLGLRSAVILLPPGFFLGGLWQGNQFEAPETLRNKARSNYNLQVKQQRNSG